MATIKPTFTVDKINEYLRKYRKITFKEGTYVLDKMITVCSNTKIKCQPGVIFKRNCLKQMMEMEASNDVTGYNGTHDVTWSGGTFIANTRKEDAIVIVLYHCKNITLKNITVDGCRGYHSIECNSSQNVKIKNCTFKNQSSLPGVTYREAIQIDFAYQLGYPYRGNTNVHVPANDGTHCKDIYITGCKFENCPNGIGTHTVCLTPMYHEHIVITDCEFKDIEKCGIQLFSMKDVIIKNCPTALIGVFIKKKAHKLTGEMVDLSEKDWRYNINVRIDSNIIVQ